jgi:hypothetical protein
MIKSPKLNVRFLVKRLSYSLKLVLIVVSCVCSSTFLAQSPYEFMTVQVNFGGGTDFNVPQNIYLVSGMSVGGLSFNLPMSTTSSVGIHFDSDVRQTNDNAFIEYMEVDTNRHKDLIQLSQGNHNTWQLGAHYRYTLSKEKLFITATAGIGLFHARQNSHLMEYYPFDTTLYNYKRFVTTRADINPDGWGWHARLTCDGGVSFDGWALFLGVGYAYGQSTKHNVYVAEYDRNDIDYFTYYSEEVHTSRIDFHVGAILVIKPDTK